ncbi:U32 family peptidase [Halarcobacter sp.]|uniref:U32 family peptidase n=1 Tax=Halarcobacter sp. TaxID=2321133 RepID=UPI0029F5A588|nr:U32 family peptidase [Halarcobacter sp.]
MNKVIIGIDEDTNITVLLNQGIKQFYFGYLPKEYYEKYSSQTSLNRRYRVKEQFTNLDKIYETIDIIHKNNATIYLALNSFTSNTTMLEYSKKIYELFYKKVDAIIVANITMAQFLKSQNYSKIVLSNLFGLYTTNAVKFFKGQFNPYKFILPRDIQIKDLETIVSSFPDDKFECFLFGDNCRYSESFCFSEHGYDSVGFGSLCNFAFTNKKPIQSASASFKQIVKNRKLNDQEKKELLNKHFLDLNSLLDEIELNRYEFNSQNIAKCLDRINRYDINYLKESKKDFIRLLNLLKSLEFPKAKEILNKLKAVKFEDMDYYPTFHKLNNKAILATIRIFEKHKNIVSYKVPSRGRELYKLLNELNENETYDYTKSQYQL